MAWQSLRFRRIVRMAYVAIVVMLLISAWLAMFGRKSLDGFYTYSGFATDDLLFFYLDGTNVWVCSEKLPPDFSGQYAIDPRTSEYKWTLKNGSVISVRANAVQITGYDSAGQRLMHEWRRIDIGSCKAVVAKWRQEMNKIISQNGER